MTSALAKSIERISSASTIAASDEPRARNHRRNGRARPTSTHLSMVASTDESNDASGEIANSDDGRRRLPPPLSIEALHANSVAAAAASNPSSPSGNPRRLGSKANAGVYHTIINQMPPHRVYIEPFLGWATIMKAKLSADRNIGIDRNGDTIATAEAGSSIRRIVDG